jgi:hypothetical protein
MIYLCIEFFRMKKWVLISSIIIFCSTGFVNNSSAQCSICTKTAQQLGERPAKGLNAGIIYLAATPFLIAGYVFYRWRKSDHSA